MLAVGQPAMRTIPPLTTAAARNGTALDRSGSITQCRAAIGPGDTCQRLAWRVVDVDARLAQHRHRHRDVRRRRHRLAGVHDGQPVGERRARTAAGRRRTATTPTRRSRRVPPAHRSRAAHRERQTVAVDVHAEAAQRVQQRCDRAGPGLLVAVEDHGLGAERRHRWHEPQHGARQAAVHPGVGRRGDSSADRQLGVVAVDGDAQRAQRADHQVGVAAAQRAADGRRALRRWPAPRARAPGWSATSSRARSPWRAQGSASSVPASVLSTGLHPALSPVSATMGYMCGRFAVTTDPALLAEKIQAIDESTTSATEGLQRAQLQRRTDHHDQHGGQTPQRTRRRVDPAGAADALGARAAVGQGSRGRRAGHQGPAADQRPRREGHQLARVPQLGEEQALPGADGRLVRVAAERRERSGKKAPKTPFYMYGADGEPLFMAGLWSTWRPKDAPKDSSAAAELHDHHHRCGGPAGRDPRPDAADDQRRATGTAGSTPTRPSTRDCCAGTATSTGSRSARCRGWSTASATTAPS